MPFAIQHYVTQFCAILCNMVLYFAFVYVIFYAIKQFVANRLSATVYFVILLILFTISIGLFVYYFANFNALQSNNVVFIKLIALPSTLVIPILYLVCALYFLVLLKNIILLLTNSVLKPRAKQFLLQLPLDGQQYFDLLCSFHNIKFPSLIVHTKALAPFTKGFFKKVIIIPLAIANHFSYNEMELIILHELAHIKRGDHYWNIILHCSKILFSSIPFANILLHQAVLERELACDNWVLQQQVTPKNYGNVLYKIATLQQQKVNLQLQFNVPQNTLLYRIKHLFNENKNIQFRFSLKPIVTLLLAFVIINTAQIPSFNNLPSNIEFTHIVQPNKVELKKVKGMPATFEDTIVILPKSTVMSDALPADTNASSLEKAYNDNVPFLNGDACLVSQNNAESEFPLAVAIASNFTRIQNTILNVYDTVQIMQKQITTNAVQKLTKNVLQQLMHKAITQNEYESNLQSNIETVPLKVLQNGEQNYYYNLANLQYQIQYNASLQQWLVHFEVINNNKVLAKQNVRFVVQKKLQEVNL